MRRQNSSYHRNNCDRVRFRTDLQKQCLLNCSDERRWILTESDDDWNVYWANIGKIRKIFNFESGIRLRDDQIVNHFPNYYELTRKDLMVKNLKRYKKQIEKQGKMNLMDFVPISYNLPAEYPIFEEQFRKNSNNKSRHGIKWIIKPSSRAQGNGIFIINKLSQFKKFAASSKYHSNESYVVSKYIDKPLLIGGRKFDLRLFAVVTAYRPLKIYFYSEGFARFSNLKYTTERGQMNNTEVHLTNVAIQKHSSEYNPNHGNKWKFSNVMLFVEGIFGNENAEALLQKIKNIIIHSCASVQNVIINDKHCFELYGFDIIIDEQLKPWLIEINSSPSLSATTSADRTFKRKLIFDLFQVIVPSDFPNTKTSQGYTHWCSKKKVGDFHLIYNEEDDEQKMDDSANGNGQNDEKYADSQKNNSYDATNKYQKKKYKTGWR